MEIPEGDELAQEAMNFFLDLNRGFSSGFGDAIETRRFEGGDEGETSSGRDRNCPFRR